MTCHVRDIGNHIALAARAVFKKRITSLCRAGRIPEFNLEINMAKKVLITNLAVQAALLSLADGHFKTETTETLVLELAPNSSEILVIEDGKVAELLNYGAESATLAIEGGEFIDDDGERSTQFIYLQADDTIRVSVVGEGYTPVTADEQAQTGTENEGSKTD